jgi:uncharacterized protein YkwD
MNNPNKNYGHLLYATGAFLLLFTTTFMQPVNIRLARALNASEIINKTNETRQRLNKTELNVNQKLMSGAQTKAEDMAKRQYFAHFGPDGQTPWEFFETAGYDYEIAGENLAITNESEQKVIDGWMNSTTHKDNLLNSKYTDFGIGIAYFGDYQSHKNTTVVVAFYGKAKQPNSATTEVTSPAGTIAALKNDGFGGVSQNLIISLAFSLIIAGLLLETRHIRQHHHNHKPNL